MAEKPVKRSWTAITTSFGEVVMVVESGHVEFPLMAIPWGAERGATVCRYFRNLDEMDAETFETLFQDAWPHNGMRKVHLIHTKSVLPASFVYQEQ